jgi:hypothetical protein
MLRTLLSATLLAALAIGQAFAHGDKPKAGTAAAKEGDHRKADDKKDAHKKNGHGHDKKH